MFFLFFCFFIGGVIVVDNDFNNSYNDNYWRLGHIFIREGNFDEADRCFVAELNQSDSPNALVFADYGHLLNMMGRYEDANVHFDRHLNTNPNYVNSLFGKGISFIGLNRLDEALFYFEKVLNIDYNHADAWYYSAIIYGNPFYHEYNPSYAKNRYKNYQNSKEDYIKNPDYFKKPFDNLSLEEVHNYYKFSNLFHLIDQLLEREIDEFDNFLNDYRRLYSFKEDLDKQSDTFRLFDDDISLDDKIDELNNNKQVEDKFKSTGYDEDLVHDLSSQFGGLSIENKKILIELMNYFKTSQLSFKDIDNLIREYVLDGDMSLDSFNEDKENIVESRIEEKYHKIARNIEKKVNSMNKKTKENKQLEPRGVIVAGDDFNNSDNVSNWELGRRYVREGKFDDADRCFETERTQSDSPNPLVFDDHGHLLNIMGQYEHAIDKFNSQLNIKSNFVSSLFGKGISYIGLNRLDDALYYFNEVIEIDDKHAGAWYYSAIIYGNPFYRKYNPNSAKKHYKNYQNSIEDYINKPFEFLSLEEVHNYYNPSNLFRLIDQLLERNIDEFDNFLQYYRRLNSFEEDLDKQSDTFRLFNDDIRLDDKIDELNKNKQIEDEFKSAGYDKNLIDELSSRFGGLSIENKKILIELMEYFKTLELSFKDINKFIRVYVLEEDGDSVLYSFNENKKYIVEGRIADKKIKHDEIKSDLDKKIAENKQLKNYIGVLENEKKKLADENKDLEHCIQNLKKVCEKTNKPNMDYKDLINKLKSLIKDYPDNELLNKMDSDVKEYSKDASSITSISGIYNEDFKEDKKILKVKFDISEESLKNLDSGFKNFDEGNFYGALKNFNSEKSIPKLKNYMNCLILTSKYREGQLESAYMRCKEMIKEKNSEINKNPMCWFNFGNICFDYAYSKYLENSKKSNNKAKEVFDLAIEYYDYANDIVSNMKENSEHKFEFKDDKSKEEFNSNIQRMKYSADILLKLIEFKVLQTTFEKDFENLQNAQRKILNDFNSFDKLQEIFNDGIKQLKSSKQ